ncbi:MAG: hypothetical protein F6K17_35175 [Okeania sp. SIO3C4]|nr:hypothetical protein [Okeania sp. SIO3B3]NER07440.1 hypothetical protein [Okeania sp. SIO3C4]
MLEAGGRRFSSIVILILYTNNATGHDMRPYFLVRSQSSGVRREQRSKVSIQPSAISYQLFLLVYDKSLINYLTSAGWRK